MNPAISQHMDEVYYHIGNLLSCSREIIQKILVHLGYQDLVTAVQVCESWSLVGLPILEKRRLRYITIHPNGYKNADLQIVNGLPSSYELLEDFFGSINYKSVHCLGFTCGGWLDRGDIITKFSPHGTTFPSLLKNVFPKNCEMASLEASGVIGSVQISPDKNTPKKRNLDRDEYENSYKQISKSFNQVGYSIELEESPNNSPADIPVEALSLIVFPKQPGVKINIFNLDEDKFYKDFRSNEDSPDISAPWGRGKELKSGFPRQNEVSQYEFDTVCGLELEDDLKALLLFTYTLRSLTRSFLDAAQFRQNDKVAVGGGLVDWVQRDGDYFKGTIGIAISGRNVQTASVVVPPSVRDVKSLKIILEKLKEKGLPEGHSMCFMFSCCGRGSCWYKKSDKDFCNVETRAFRSLFPNTPIFGFFGDGEIGNNFYSRDEGEEEEGCSSASYEDAGTHQFQPRKKKKRKQNLFHQFSTIFVLVSFL